MENTNQNRTKNFAYREDDQQYTAKNEKKPQVLSMKASKYDFLKIKVISGGQESILSRYLLSRLLSTSYVIIL